MRFVFLMDPLESVKARTDTSYIFMLGAQRQGHEIWYCPTRSVSLLDGKVFMQAQRVKVLKPDGLYDLNSTENLINPFEICEERKLEGKEIDAVFIRTDPPFDDGYLMNTWMLEQSCSIDFKAEPLFYVIPQLNSRQRIKPKIKKTEFTIKPFPAIKAENDSNQICYFVHG